MPPLCDLRCIAHRAVWLLMVMITICIQCCNSKPVMSSLERFYRQCAMLPNNSTIVDLSFCGLKDLPDFVFKRFEHLNKLNLSHNDLSILNHDELKYNHKLYDLDISFNPKFGQNIHGTQCVIESDSIRYLNLAHTGFGVIHPRSICLPKLRFINLVGVSECENTRRLFKQIKPSVKIICGGSDPHHIFKGSTLSPFNPQSPTISELTTAADDSALHGSTLPTRRTPWAPPPPTSSPAVAAATTPQAGTALPLPPSADTPTNSSTATTSQPFAVATSPGAHDEILPNSTSGPVNDDTNRIWEYILGGLVIVVLAIVGVCYYCPGFRSSLSRRVRRIWENCHSVLFNRSTNHTNRAVMNSESSLFDENNDSDVELSSPLTR